MTLPLPPAASQPGLTPSPISTIRAVRRLVVVLARHAAVAPPGIAPDAFVAASLADSYEVAADLVGVTAGIAGDPSTAELLWPGAPHFEVDDTVGQLAETCAGSFDHLVVMTADVPDLPGMVLAKMLRALGRSPVSAAPERHGPGLVALGMQLPRPGWLPPDFDLNGSPAELRRAAPRDVAIARAPEWTRLRTPAAVSRLDPGLEGWEETRALLSGRAWPASRGAQT